MIWKQFKKPYKNKVASNEENINGGWVVNLEKSQ